MKCTPFCLRNFGPVVHLRLSREDQEKLAVPETEGVYFRGAVFTRKCDPRSGAFPPEGLIRSDFKLSILE
jgi:hypothetical protein